MITNTNSIKTVLVSYLLIMLCISCADNNTYNERFFDELSAINSPSQKIQNESIKMASTHYLKESQLIEYVIDYSSQSSKSYSNHIQKICDYSKIPFAISNIKHWNSKNFQIAPSVKIINIHNPSKLNDLAVQKLLDFTARGGTVFFSSIVTDERFNFFYGLKLNANFDYDLTAAGFKFMTPLLPNMTGLKIKTEHIHYGLKNTNFMKAVYPLIVAVNNPNYGAILEHKIGEGRVVFFNSELMIDKFTRGLVFSLFLPSLEAVPYPIVSASTIYLDDFPSPVYTIMKEPISTELGISMDKFVDDVWWPDMQKLAKEFNINYATTVTFDYTTKVTPPFIFTEWERTKKKNTTKPLSGYFTNSILHNKHELALHGFNHVSLTKHDWVNTDFIATALKTVKKKWKVEGYGNLPTSYIPPSNVIDSTGLAKLKQTLPSIQYICSSYFGKLNEGSDREFDIDPYNSSLFDYPRVTSEYELNDEKLYVKESVYAFTGIWSHFVHPDDVYQISDESNIKTSGDFDYRNANGYGWHTSNDGSEGLYPRFKKLLKQHKNTYPLTQFINAKDGASRINQWRFSDYYHQNTKLFYTVKKKGISHLKTHYWLVYISKEHINEFENYLDRLNSKHYKTPLSNGYLVNISTKSPFINIPKFKKSTDKNEIYASVMKEYKNHMNDLIALHEDMSVKIIEVDENAINNERLESLNGQLFSSKAIDTTVWNSYARLNDWLNKPQDVWVKLERFYKTNSTIEVAKYSSELAKISWYPNEDIQEYWLLEQIKKEPKNYKLLEKYIKLYNSEERTERITKYLKLIAEIKNTKESKNNYIKHILWQNSNDIEVLLASVDPSEDYNDIADDIAWFYYEKEDIEKASSWAVFTDEIDIAIKLDWLNTLEDYENIKKVYDIHMKRNPNDNKARTAMAYIYHSKGDFKKAWLVTDSIINTYPGKNALQKMLNNDVKYVSSDLQEDLINGHSKLFKQEIKDSLIEDIRLKTANSIIFKGDIASDKSNSTSFEKISSYLIKDKKKFTHGISFTNSDIYALNTPNIDIDNIDKELFGLQYRISNSLKFKKLQYWSKARIEKDRGDQLYYQFGIGASLSRIKAFTSLQYNIHPVKNGVAYNKHIYRNTIGLYHENHLNKAITTIGYAEGNYYSDNVYSVSLTGKLQYNLIKKPKTKLYPFLESTFSTATKNQPGGYPYWVVNHRFYGGAGIGSQFGIQEQSKFLFSADVAHFRDDYSDYFTRFNGKVSIRFLKYYVFQTSAEYYIQSKYYSNQFNFGLQYYLK